MARRCLGFLHVGNGFDPGDKQRLQLPQQAHNCTMRMNDAIDAWPVASMLRTVPCDTPALPAKSSWVIPCKSRCARIRCPNSVQTSSALKNSKAILLAVRSKNIS